MRRPLCRVSAFRASSTISASTLFASSSMVDRARIATSGSLVTLNRYEASAAARQMPDSVPLTVPTWSARPKGPAPTNAFAGVG
jgi:hypothetical protein